MRVVTGSFADTSAPPPLTSGVTMLDIEMGPDDEVLLPLDSRLCNIRIPHGSRNGRIRESRGYRVFLDKGFTALM